MQTTNFTDCKHYLAHNKGYEILNIYDNELDEIQTHHDSTQLGIPLTEVKAKFYRSKNNQYISMFPWIEDSNFFPIQERDDGSPNLHTHSQVLDRLQQWIR